MNVNNPKVRAALDGAGLSQAELVALAVHALEEAGVTIDAEPGDPVLVAVARASSYRFRVDKDDGLVVE
jgi:hypothetical protein